MLAASKRILGVQFRKSTVVGHEHLYNIDSLSEFLLTNNSLRNRHELSDCQSSLHLPTQPPDLSKEEMGSHDDRLLSLWVSRNLSLGDQSLRPRLLS